MRPVHFARIGLIVASTLLLAQSSPSSFNQKHSASASRYAQGSPIGHNANKNVVHPAESSQAEGLSFAKPVSYATGGTGTTALAIGDLNGDGAPDLVVTSCANTGCTGTGLISVLLGNGDGTFKTAVTYSSGGQGPESVAIADVNNDGKPDLVVANFCANPCVADGTVSVLLGNGDGTFQAAVNYDPGGLETESVAVADLSGNGKLDVVAANACATSPCSLPSTTGTVSVLMGNGDGTFQAAVTYNAGGPAESVALGDLNGDGKPDVAVLSYAGCTFCPGEVGVLLNNGDGTLQTVVTYSSGGTFPTQMTLASLRGDGKLDALVAEDISATGHGPGGFAVLLGNGDGTFQSVVGYGLSQDDDIGTNNVAVADVNGDGKPDVILGDREMGMAVMLGNGDGTFQPEVSFGATSFGGSVAAADLNGDGLPDVALAAGSSPLVYVFINTSTTAIISPTSLSFAPQAPGTKSAQQTVTLTNIATAALPISSISITGSDASGFSQTNNCPSSLASNGSCQINVISNPQAGGAQSASLSIADNLPSSPQTIALTGTGEDFSMSASPTSNTVTPGQAGNYTVTLAPLSGFSQKVALSCSGAPAQSTCTVSPSTVTLNGTANATASVAVVTAGSSSRMLHPLFPSGSSSLALWLALPGLSGLLFVGAGSQSRKRQGRWLRMLALIGIVSLVAIWPACGGGSGGSGSGSGTPAGNYTVTVTGTYTSGSVAVTHTTKLTLVVQ